MRALFRELPFLLGLAVGAYLLWRWGWAFVLDGQVEGYHWADYLENAWMVVHRVDLGYAPYRYPLHGGLVGLLGEALGSYANAAILVSSVGALGLVAGAGLVGRALGGPAAGGLAAAWLPTVQVTLTSPRWGNLYTALAGASGLALGLGAAVARWPHPALAVAAGVAGGVAWGIDPRGLALVPAAGAFVLLGAARLPGWRKRAVLVLAFVLPLCIGPVSKRALWLETRAPPGAVQQLQFQRKVFLRWATRGHLDTGMPAACHDEDPRALPSLAAVQTDCAVEMARFNWGRAIPRQLPAPALLVALLSVGCLAPRRGEPRTAVAEGAALLVLGVGPLAAFSLWMPFPDRYLLQFAVPLCAVAPVGLVRVAGAAPRLVAPGLAAMAAALTFGLAWQADPTTRFSRTTTRQSPEVLLHNAAAGAVGERLGDGRSFLDCADLHLPARWLPRLLADPPMMELDDARCLTWLASPAVDRFVLLRERVPMHESDGKQVNLDEHTVGWVEVWRKEDLRLLRGE